MTRAATKGEKIHAAAVVHGAPATLALLFLFVSAGPSLAHHVMGGALPSTLWEGTLSGLAHPLIGIDHFAFMLAAALLVIRQQLAYLMLAAFVAASTAGVLLHLALVNLPAAEITIAVSVFIFGGGIVLRRSLNSTLLTALLVAAGVYHGYAFGESIVGAERSPLLAYLLGLAAIQYLVLVGALMLARYVGMPTERSVAYRGAGAVIALIGLVLFATQFAHL